MPLELRNLSLAPVLAAAIATSGCLHDDNGGSGFTLNATSDSRITADADGAGGFTIASGMESRTLTARQASNRQIHRLTIPGSGGNDDTVLNIDRERTATLAMAFTNGNRSVLENADSSADAIVEGFQFSGYGAWVTGDPASSLGAEAFGTETTAAQRPTSGTEAAYEGRTAGFLSAGGQTYVTLSDFSATVDFEGNSVAYHSTNTRRGAIIGSDGMDVPPNQNTGLPDIEGAENLNFAGQATLAADGSFADNDGFNHGVNAQGTDGTPDAAARLNGDLYGPEAQEMGGEFHIPSQNYFGSFGAAQPANDG